MNKRSRNQSPAATLRQRLAAAAARVNDCDLTAYNRPAFREPVPRERLDVVGLRARPARRG